MLNKACTIAVSSITYAMKAQGILAQANISTSVIRLRPELTQNGCAYGLELSCRETDRAASLLQRAGIQNRLIR